MKNGNPEFFFWSGMTTPEDAPSYFQKLYRKVFKAAGAWKDLRTTSPATPMRRTVEVWSGHQDSVQGARAQVAAVTERFYAKWNRAQQDKMDDTLRTALG